MDGWCLWYIIIEHSSPRVDNVRQSKCVDNDDESHAGVDNVGQQSLTDTINDSAGDTIDTIDTRFTLNCELEGFRDTVVEK